MSTEDFEIDVHAAADRLRNIARRIRHEAMSFPGSRRTTWFRIADDVESHAVDCEIAMVSYLHACEARRREKRRRRRREDDSI